MNESFLKNVPLGKKSEYITQYNPALLVAIPRQLQREKLQLTGGALPFYGYDVLNAYELSWLNSKGKPEVAIGRFILPCQSPNLLESKSIKLYLNSFNGTKFDSRKDVAAIIAKDMSLACGGKVEVEVFKLDACKVSLNKGLTGQSLDDLDISITNYNLAADLLYSEEQEVAEILCSNLLKSNCLVTGQPDWGSVCIKYRGRKINHENFLRYLISFRQHNEFHEHCVERIFCDIMRHCQVEELTVDARYTRRGGVDINPIRSTLKNIEPGFERLIRQ